MAETSRASTSSSADESYKEIKRMKWYYDFISALPDCLIQQILSFLPSTKDAVRTCILSKRWLNQWTHVQNLIFNCKEGMSIENFTNFIDQTLNLYNCSKINKFVIDSNDLRSDELRDKMSSWVIFAVARDVKELVLDSTFDAYDNYELPECLFKNAFLVKLKVHSCYFSSPGKGKVNWASLKALYIEFAYLSDNVIQDVLSGSPVLEYLELCSCYGFERLIVASKSLKTFRLSESDGCNAVEISCANLEKLELLGQMSFTCFKLEDLPRSVCATLDFEIEEWDNWDYDSDIEYGFDASKWVKEFLLQVHHIEDLKLGSCILTILSFYAEKRELSQLLDSKSLTVIDPFLVETQPGISFLLTSCSVLEKLVIQLHGGESFRIWSFVEIEKDFWESDASAFDCPVSHLKTVEIVGLYYISTDGVHKDVLKILTFLLKNAIMLENMVFFEDCGQGMVFAHDVCKKLECVQKASPSAIVEVECVSMVDVDSDSDWNKFVC